MCVFVGEGEGNSSAKSRFDEVKRFLSLCDLIYGHFEIVCN